MRLAQVTVSLRPGAPEPEPSAGVEVIRAVTIRQFRATREDPDEAQQAVQAALDAYLAVAGDQAQAMGPVVVVPGEDWAP
jgi:hypothetical protein